MTNDKDKIGVLLVSHGSPRKEANAGFASMVENISSRTSGLIIKPTFFSLVRPSIEDRVAEFAAEGVSRIYLLPYFLYNGKHITVDIPEVLETCRNDHPEISIEMLPTLQNEPMMEEIMLDRLQACIESKSELPVTPDGITAKSKQIIDTRLGPADSALFERSVIRRVIHSTADFSFNTSLRIHPDAERVSREVFSAGHDIVCDVKMVRAGITKAINCTVHCAISDEDVAAEAKRQGCTRSAAAMEKLAEKYDNGIVAIGNAPTALWQVMEIAERGGPRPALVVGVPVGFVGALESKQALFDSDLCYITNLSNRGGSPVAASIVNALASFKGE
ncbi:MAG: precorrin-8X methylmutase [Kiritimatiellia bacterium]|jgi:precorrin-8X/cobalt-precorrin-8 methylmutase|nr:precorrin-8X methylmutase [Kiritimatiellia bacterium]